MNLHQVSKSTFKAKALELLREVESSGQSLIVTDHGKPTLEVRPYHPSSADPLTALRGTVVRYDDPTAPVADNEWEASL